MRTSLRPTSTTPAQPQHQSQPTHTNTTHTTFRRVRGSPCHRNLTACCHHDARSHDAANAASNAATSSARSRARSTAPQPAVTAKVTHATTQLVHRTERPWRITAAKHRTSATGSTSADLVPPRLSLRLYCLMCVLAIKYRAGSVSSVCLGAACGCAESRPRPALAR